MKYLVILLFFVSLSASATDTIKVEDENNSNTQPTLEALNEQLIRRQVEAIRRRSELQNYKKKREVSQLTHKEQGFVSNESI